MQDNPKTNVKAILSLILSSMSLVCCFQWQSALFLATLGIVLGVLGLRGGNPNQHDAAIAGIVIGVVAVLVAVVIAVLWIIMSKNASEQGMEPVSTIVRSISYM